MWILSFFHVRCSHVRNWLPSLTSTDLKRRKQLLLAWKLLNFAAISCWTLSLTAALCNTFFPPWRTLTGRHWLSLHRNDKWSCWSTQNTSSSIFPLRILLASQVTSWRTQRPCVGKFTAGCNHLLCNKGAVLELLHLLECAALYYKCAISIHEGIYMHSQAMLPEFISHAAHSKSCYMSPM